MLYYWITISNLTLSAVVYERIICFVRQENYIPIFQKLECDHFGYCSQLNESILLYEQQFRNFT